jgi:hypothetical protein
MKWLDVIASHLIHKRFNEAYDTEVMARHALGNLAIARLRMETLKMVAIRPVVEITGTPVFNDVKLS